jgi:hypothetical protein
MTTAYAILEVFLNQESVAVSELVRDGFEFTIKARLYPINTTVINVFHTREKIKELNDRSPDWCHNIKLDTFRNDIMIALNGNNYIT